LSALHQGIIKVGDELILKRQPCIANLNEYDNYAIAIFTHQSTKIGHVLKNNNRVMDQGLSGCY